MKKISSLEKKLHASAFAFVVAMSAASYSHAHEGAMNGTYVGLDAVYNWMGFKQDFGKNIFKKNAPGMNFFVGHMFHDNFGAELGFEWDKKMKRDVTITTVNTVVAGQSLQVADVPASFKTTVKQSHPYLGVVAKTNVFGDDNFVSLMLGMSMSRIKGDSNWYSVHGVAQTYIKTFSKTKLIPVVRATFEHKFNHQFGVRALASWRNTSAFKMDSKESGTKFTAKLRDTFSVGLGVAYYI